MCRRVLSGHDIDQVLGGGRLGPHSEHRSGEDWETTELRSARVLPTSVALLSLLKDFWSDRGDSVPTMPNWHAAAHAVHPEQTTRSTPSSF